MAFMLRKRNLYLLLLGVFVSILIVYLVGNGRWFGRTDVSFDGQHAMRDVQYQVSLGARIPGSQAHSESEIPARTF